MESISVIRQLMAESKYFEAQHEAESLLTQKNFFHRAELIPLYFEILLTQTRPLPAELIFEICGVLWRIDPDSCSHWLQHLQKSDEQKFHREHLLLKMQLAEKKGKLKELESLLSELQIYLIEKKIPFVPEVVLTFTEKYFKHDFKLAIQRLTLALLTSDLLGAEGLIKELILSCFEKASLRGIEVRLRQLLDVLSHFSLGHLEIYRNLCWLLVDDETAKKDHKKMSEFIIYFDEFSFQVLILHLLDKTGRDEVAQSYAKVIRSNRHFDFVHLSKYHGQLKKFFITTKEVGPQGESVQHETPDLKVEGKKVSQELFTSAPETEQTAEEERLIHFLNHQEFPFEQLNDIATSLIQSSLPRAALKASEKALKIAHDAESFLRACYLCLTCHLYLKDYRAALDMSLEGLGRSQNQEDILSFLYGQAECYMQLGQKKLAKNTLKRIVQIDSRYRLAKERLEMLNEV